MSEWCRYLMKDMLDNLVMCCSSIAGCTGLFWYECVVANPSRCHYKFSPFPPPGFLYCVTFDVLLPLNLLDESAITKT